MMILVVIDMNGAVFFSKCW